MALRPITRRLGGTVAALSALSSAPLASASPPPSGSHPRLFMGAEDLAGYTANAKAKGTAAAGLVAACQDTLDNPGDYTTRGGSDGNAWPGSAIDCAFAYQATQDAKYLTQAIKFWQASLDDDQTLGDGMGCVAGVDTSWQSWDGNPPAPPVIRTITHDTGYPMRWYGPDIALTYDWLYGAPGVTEARRAQTRTCLTAWIDYYTANGYHADQAGANYNAGYVIGKTLGAIAIGTDGGADGHLWTETTTELFPKLLIGKGLVGRRGPRGHGRGGDGRGRLARRVAVRAAQRARVRRRGARAGGRTAARCPRWTTWASSLAVLRTSTARSRRWTAYGSGATSIHSRSTRTLP